MPGTICPTHRPDWAHPHSLRYRKSYHCPFYYDRGSAYRYMHTCTQAENTTYVRKHKKICPHVRNVIILSYLREENVLSFREKRPISRCVTPNTWKFCIKISQFRDLLTSGPFPNKKISATCVVERTCDERNTSDAVDGGNDRIDNRHHAGNWRKYPLETRSRWKVVHDSIDVWASGQNHCIDTSITTLASVNRKQSKQLVI